MIAEQKIANVQCKMFIECTYRSLHQFTAPHPNYPRNSLLKESILFRIFLFQVPLIMASTSVTFSTPRSDYKYKRSPQKKAIED
jgi:hypothetical protein